jgi:hypothetical protein
VREVEDRLVDARVMQRIFDHNRHVWAAIQGSGAEDSYWGLGKPVPPLTKGAKELLVLPPSPHLLTIPSLVPSRPPSPPTSPPPLPVPLRLPSPTIEPARRT